MLIRLAAGPIRSVQLLLRHLGGTLYKHKLYKTLEGKSIWHNLSLTKYPSHVSLSLSKRVS